MKVIVAILLLLALAVAQSPELRACIEKKCPDQYEKCKKTNGCEAKLEKCAKQCGEKVAQTCWTLCIGIPGAAANVCTCAVSQNCITKITKIDRLGLNLMEAIETYIDQ
jgi:hypothetical protein